MYLKCYFILQLATDYLQCDDFLIADFHVDDQRHLVFVSPSPTKYYIKYLLETFFILYLHIIFYFN